MRIALVAFLAVLPLAACGLVEVDRLDVQQGNRLEREEIRAVQVGMSRTEVQELLGTPVLESPFHAERWDYVYYESEAGRGIEHKPRRLTILFDGDRVARIEDRFTAPAGTTD